MLFYRNQGTGHGGKWGRLLSARAAAWALALFSISVSAHATEIWLAGLYPAFLARIHPGEASDYLSMFTPNAPWQRAASAVNVFKIIPEFVTTTTDGDLRRVFADLKRRRIALAMEVGLISTQSTCGQGVEGYSTPAQLALLARATERIRDMGGNLSFVAIDGPLASGHEYGGAKPCHTPIVDLARDVAVNAKMFKIVFPSVMIGDIEIFGDADRPGWTDEIMQWTKAYQAAAGEPFAFLDTDVIWSGPWRREMPALAARLRASGIKFGIIYNGDASDQTGLAWTRHAEERFVEIESGLRLVPDQAILQTWHSHPTHMLPETEPGTMTWLVDRYIAAPTQLVLARHGTVLDGEIKDTAGQGLAHVPVTLMAEEYGHSGAPAQHTYSGTVPPNATTAIFALRVNTECYCSGPADLDILPMTYRDGNSGQAVQREFRSVNGTTHFQAQPGQAILQNTAGFAVAAGDQFTIDIPMRTNPTSADSGYVAIIFMDAQGHATQRVSLPFGPAMHPLADVSTDTEGHFSLQLSAGVLSQASGFCAKFLGTPSQRLAEARTQ